MHFSDFDVLTNETGADSSMSFYYEHISSCIIPSLLYRRYIQGAPLLGNSAVASDEILAVDTPSEGGEAVIVSTNEKSTPSSVTWRARFVGQGYKQV